MTDRSRQPSGIPAGGEFAAKTHAEAGVVLDNGAARIEAAYDLVNEAASLEGMRVGPVHPDYFDHLAEYQRAVEGARAVLDEVAGPELQAKIDTALAEEVAERLVDLEADRERFASALSFARKAKSAAEAVAAIEQVIPRSSISGWKVPTRAQATEAAEDALASIERQIIDVHGSMATHTVIERLPEPERTWLKRASWDVIRDRLEMAVATARSAA
jgi:hypothetical protein